MSDEQYALLLQMHENEKAFANSRQAVPGQYPPYIAPPGMQGSGGGFSHAPIPSPPLSPISSSPSEVRPPPEPQPPPQPLQPRAPTSFNQSNRWAQQSPTIFSPPSPSSSASNTSSGYVAAIHNPFFYNYPEPQIPLPSSTMVIQSSKGVVNFRKVMQL